MHHSTKQSWRLASQEPLIGFAPMTYLLSFSSLLTAPSILPLLLSIPLPCSIFDYIMTYGLIQDDLTIRPAAYILLYSFVDPLTNTLLLFLALSPSLPSSIPFLIFVTRFQLVPEVLRGNRSLHIHHQSSPRSNCSVHEHRYSFSYFFNTNNNKKTNKILGLSVYVINKQSTAATFSLSQSGQYSFGPGSYFISILL